MKKEEFGVPACALAFATFKKPTFWQRVKIRFRKFFIKRWLGRPLKINPVFHIRNFLANQWFEYLQGDWKFRN